jgi:hypothetical protein
MAQMLTNQTPLVVVYAVGLVVAYLKRRRCRPVAALVIAGLALMLAVTVSGWVAYSYLMTYMRSGPSITKTTWMEVTGWVYRIALAVGTALLISAAFVGRTPTRAPDEGD